jgi:lysophospholipase L1-like esterase
MKELGVFLRGCLVAALCVGGIATARDHDEHHEKVLVLGDSVAFGYIASADSVGYFYTRPENFIGFPDDLGDMLHLDVVNASCPGESTGSFLSSTAPDVGCRGYRGSYPLHAEYKSTQIAFATTYLRSHREVRLVTITLGANDVSLLEKSCDHEASCVLTGLPAVGTNIGTILSELRATGYGGAIVITNYYSTDYSDAPQAQLTAALNAAIAAPAEAHGAVVADVFTAFQTVASDPAFAGKTCLTGLLNPDVSGPDICNKHPALAGHRLIAKTIARTLAAENRY